MTNRSRHHRLMQSVVRFMRGVIVEPVYGLGYLLERCVNAITGLTRRMSSREWDEQGTKRPDEPISCSSGPSTGRKVLASFRFWLGYPFFLIWQWCQALGNFRDRRGLLWGLPALAVGIVCVGLLIAAANIPRARLVQKYETAALAAYDRQDFDEATTYYEKLCSLRPEEDRFRYMLGRIAETSGDMPKAFGFMNQLAPLDRQGYGRAHVWIAKQQLAQLDGRRIEDAERVLQARNAIERHLQFAIQDDDGLWEAKLLLGQLLARSEPQRALLLLKQVTHERPQTSLILADLQRKLGEPDEARRTLEGYIPQLRQAIQNPGLEQAARRSAVDRYLSCLLTLQRFREAEDLVRRQAALLGRDNARLGVSKVHYAWAVAELAKPPEQQNLSTVVAHLDDALRSYSGNLAALQLLMNLLQRDIGQQRQIVDLLLDTVVDGRATATTYIVLGNYYNRVGNVEQSLRYYDRASSRAEDPKLLGSIYNNIAWLCLQQDPPDHVSALNWIEKAFQTGVVLPEYHDTRGQALAGLEQWEAARDDLQTGMGNLSQLRDIRNPVRQANLVRLRLPTVRAMIRCQQALGDVELQRRYEQRLTELENLSVELGVATDSQADR